MTEQILATQTVSWECYSSEIPHSPQGLIEWLQQKITVIPEEYQKSAMVEFYSDEDGNVSLSFSYKRPETPEEQKRRLAGENLVRLKEIATLKQLLAKYGVPQ